MIVEAGVVELCHEPKQMMKGPSDKKKIMEQSKADIMVLMKQLLKTADGKTRVSKQVGGGKRLRPVQ